MSWQKEAKACFNMGDVCRPAALTATPLAPPPCQSAARDALRQQKKCFVRLFRIFLKGLEPSNLSLSAHKCRSAKSVQGPPACLRAFFCAPGSPAADATPTLRSWLLLPCQCVRSKPQPFHVPASLVFSDSVVQSPGTPCQPCPSEAGAGACHNQTETLQRQPCHTVRDTLWQPHL